ncbi:MAG: hypothetical protein ACJ8AG_08355 [Ktedonobacteraceae bacterium]
MNKRLILIVGGIFLVVTFLVGAIWGWITVLAYLIGVLLVTLIVFGRYALLKFYLKTYQLRTVLYTNPISAMLYSVIDPHSRNQSHDLDDLFPSPKTQGPDESEELPPFRFTKATEEQRESNTEEHKN